MRQRLAGALGLLKKTRQFEPCFTLFGQGRFKVALRFPSQALRQTETTQRVQQTRVPGMLD